MVIIKLAPANISGIVKEILCGTPGNHTTIGIAIAIPKAPKGTNPNSTFRPDNLPASQAPGIIPMTGAKSKILASKLGLNFKF